MGGKGGNASIREGRLPRPGELSQDVRQDAAVAVVLHLDRGVDAQRQRYLLGAAIGPVDDQGGVALRQQLGLAGNETIDVRLDAGIVPQSQATLVVTGADGTPRRVPVTLRIDTPIEVDYYRHGGILPFVLRQLVARA